MRDFISGAWHLLDGWGRLSSGLLLFSAAISLYVLVTEPGWLQAVAFMEAVMFFLSVTALMVLMELYKDRLAKGVVLKPLARLGADVMEGLSISENRSVMVHIAGDSYVIESVGVGNEHE